MVSLSSNSKRKILGKTKFFSMEMTKLLVYNIMFYSPYLDSTVDKIYCEMSHQSISLKRDTSLKNCSSCLVITMKVNVK